jgi:hypothetical protein
MLAAIVMRARRHFKENVLPSFRSGYQVAMPGVPITRCAHVAATFERLGKSDFQPAARQYGRGTWSRRLTS